MTAHKYSLGIDIGSTTVKIVVLDSFNKIIFADYLRHSAEILLTLLRTLEKAQKKLGDLDIKFSVTGSAGLGISEKYNISFVQELVASSKVLETLHPEVKALIDIGGEDSKIIFTSKKRFPDIRMNGNCAGGTGAFIDQMAMLLNVSLAELNDLAAKHKNIYTIASRCGVFAKTDVQNLLSREIAREDIAASIFHSVAIQSITTLARSIDIEPKIMFSGGPLTFLPELRNAFLKVLKIQENDLILPERPELIAAIGAALVHTSETSISKLINILKNKSNSNLVKENRLEPLFICDDELQTWKQNRFYKKDLFSEVAQNQHYNCFLGIDTGSTTTKLVLLDENKKILFSYYESNKGNAIDAVTQGLKKLKEFFASKHCSFTINHSTVTGYGEDLIKSAFNLDVGVVETIAHFRAAQEFDKHTSFILDIGGQDMKAIFVRNGQIANIEINESCSSGCGSFIETFAHNLGYQTEEFANLACQSLKAEHFSDTSDYRNFNTTNYDDKKVTTFVKQEKLNTHTQHQIAPFDLGTRCTVFMNSKVKQALREGASVAEISAGLAYSVIKNCFYKVLKIRDFKILGSHIIVQGGTFKNPAVQRAFEKILGKKVICPEISELMGAYGCALIAKDFYEQSSKNKKSSLNIDNAETANNYQRQFLNCKGCLNHCTVTKLQFRNNNIFYSGNRCERIFSNTGDKVIKGENLAEYKYNLLFNRPLCPDSEPILTLGIPRVLNFYENFPFWAELFVNLGIKIQLSSQLTAEQGTIGAATIMSENICYPAKLANSHIFDLINADVDRIFYPMIIYEAKEFDDSLNSFNCPIVSGYPEVIKSSINPEKKCNIPFDTPTFAFNNLKLLKKGCWQYLRQFGIKKSEFNRVFDKAINAQQSFKESVIKRAEEIIKHSQEQEKLLIVLAGRPYHLDPLINQGIPEIITNFGVNLITEDSLDFMKESMLGELQVLSQWAYPNRLFKSAKWVANKEFAELVQLNSFGCGPDALTIDEVKDILACAGKNHTLLKIDEIISPGSVKLRLRSMFESIKLKSNKPQQKQKKSRETTRAFTYSKEKHKLLIVPNFSPFYSLFISSVFEFLGMKTDVLPLSDKQSLETGLKYTNNEICYPAILCVGDIIKALESGKYNPDDVIAGITQTGGQCRASSYASLLKKALVNAGFKNVPVATVTTGHIDIEHMTGLKFNVRKLLSRGLLAILYADSLAQMFFATVHKEANAGECKNLLENYLSKVTDDVNNFKVGAVLKTLKQAVQKFNEVKTIEGEYPQIGIVGEIYVKYNPFGNRHIIDWLINQRVEVVVPPLIDFFTQRFVNPWVNVDANVKNKEKSRIKSFINEKFADFITHRFNKVMKNFRHFKPFHSIRKLAKTGSEVVNLVHQFGEGWLIPAEIASFGKEGLNNVMSLQPFGCLANHIVAKGIEKKIRDMFPEMNLLFVDMDADTSEVNLLNRLHFLIESARNAIAG